MNRPFASPLTPALSPGGGEGDHGRAHGWFMGSGHVRGTWKLPMNLRRELCRELCRSHRVSTKFATKFGTKALPGSWAVSMGARPRSLSMNRGRLKSLEMKARLESARQRRQHNPFPTGLSGGSIFELRAEAARPERTQKKAKLPNGNTLAGVAKQLISRAPEPIFPTGTKAPKPTAATLRATSTDGDSLRFMGTIKVRLRHIPLPMNR